MSHPSRTIHEPDTLSVQELLPTTDITDDSAKQAERASIFKTKLSHFAYANESRQSTSSDMASRILRSANPKVPPATIERADKPAVGASGPGAPDEDADTTRKTAASVIESKSNKRKHDTQAAASRAKAPASKKSRTKKSNTASTVSSIPLVNNLKDTVQPGLILISIGLNPGKLTGETGHPYSHKTNKYWPGLHKSGITPIQHKPTDAHSLMHLYGLGHTNIVPDIATESESGLTAQQLLDGAATLDIKIRSLKPQAVMLLGRGIWYRWMQYKTGKRWDSKRDGPLEMGEQSEEFWVGRDVADGVVVWPGARTFVLESPSGLAAISSEARIKNWSVVGGWFTPKREEWIKERSGEMGGRAVDEAESKEDT